MGIKDFFDIIKTYCPHVLVEVKLETLCGVKVAVDISIFLNKFVKTAGEHRWLDSFIILLCTLKKYGIKPVCIFDGPNPPPEKKNEQNRRRAEAAKKQSRINHGKTILKQLETDYVNSEKPLPDELKQEIKIIMGAKREKNNVVNYSDIYDVVACMRDALDKMTRQNLPILPEYSVKAKQLISHMGFPWFQADGEAEALCAGMCHLGLVDAVLSEDTDVLAIGAPFLLSKVDLSQKKVVAISYSDILDSLEMESEEFRDLCILLGCDYNHRIKGYPPDGKNRKKAVSIGAKGAYAMIMEYRRLEHAEAYMENSDPLNYRRCRELFTPPDNLPDITIPYSNPIDRVGMEKFIKDNKIRISIKYILESWEPTPLKFIEGDVIEEDEDYIYEEGIEAERVVEVKKERVW
jgi:flap endonuclease-1